MNEDRGYRRAFFIALFLHFFLMLALIIDTASHERPVMTLEAKNEPSQALPNHPAEDEAIKAVSIDNQEVMETVNRLKKERSDQLKAEQMRQQALKREAERAKQARLQEQRRLVQLRQEEEKLAILRKKQIEQEQQHLKELAEQKQQEAKRLAELKAKQVMFKKQQQEEAEKQLQKQKEAEERVREEKVRLAKAQAELAEKNRQAAIQQAANAAAKKAQLAGEVNKYKAMIVNAISRQWILPENVDSSLSSQFRIRLAPGGTVQEVTLIRSSGDAILDRSAQTAIYKASPLPVPTDPATFDLFRDISLTVRPENVRG